MATKTDFTPEEWKKLLQSPLLASFAISAADPSGFFGLVKESFASASALAEVKANPGADALITAVVDDLLTSDGRTAARDGVKAVVTGGDVAGGKDRALADLKATVASSTPRPPPTRSPSRPGSAISRKKWRKPQAKAVSWALAANRSATRKRRRSRNSPRFWRPDRKSGGDERALNRPDHRRPTASAAVRP